MESAIYQCFKSNCYFALSFFPVSLSLYKLKTYTAKKKNAPNDNSYKFCTIVEFRLIALHSL